MKVDFGWGSAPDPLAVFKGPTSKGRKGKERGRKGGREGEGEEKGWGGEGKGEGLQPPPMRNPGYATA